MTVKKGIQIIALLFCTYSKTVYFYDAKMHPKQARANTNFVDVNFEPYTIFVIHFETTVNSHF